jgi:hypothetical protein
VVIGREELAREVWEVEGKGAGERKWRISGAHISAIFVEITDLPAKGTIGKKWGQWQREEGS